MNFALAESSRSVGPHPPPIMFSLFCVFVYLYFLNGRFFPPRKMGQHSKRTRDNSSYHIAKIQR